MELRLVLVFSCVLAAGWALPVDNNETTDDNQVSGKDEVGLMDKLNARCSKREQSACMMLKLVTYVNRLLKKSEIPITESLQVTQVSESSESLFATARESKSDEEQFGELIAEKFYNFAKTRALRWNVVDDAEIVLSTSPEKDGLGFDLSLRGTPKETGKQAFFRGS